MDLPPKLLDTYDYIVVGAGSSGCVVASRLSENPLLNVLLIEAGEEPKDFWVHTPAGMAKLFLHKRHNWNYFTEPVPSLNGRKVYWPRGKVAGGSSAINGMVYMRGHPRDFDRWESLGNEGWGWSSVLPYFLRSEANARGKDACHNADGLLKVSDPVLKHPTSHAFIQAAAQVGIQPVEDLNGPPFEGVGFQQFTIHDGVRQTAFGAFIEPFKSRSNLHVMTCAQVTRVTFEGKDATGVELVRNGERLALRARREVVLSGGVINSPQLLMLSGIGDAAHLAKFQIPLRVDAPGVGRNLQDHWFGTFILKSVPIASYNGRLHGFRKYLEGARYLLTRKGLLALGASPVSAYVKSSPEELQPDLQLIARPMTFNFNSDGNAVIDRFPGISLGVVLLNPSSAGHLELRTGDPLAAPVIHPGYLTDASDVDRLLKGMRLMREIVAREPMASLVVSEHLPGAAAQSDEQLLEHLKNFGATAFHPVGTCRMGRDDEAVVDPRLRVHGVKRLRVIDASIMPNITSGNTSAPAIMIGEKGAAMILEDAVAPTGK